MGTFGTGTLENDDAVDWLIELADEPSLDTLRDAMIEMAATPPGQYLEIDTGAEVLAAAEVLAQILGSAADPPPLERRPAAALTKQLARQPGARTVWLLAQALAAIDRVVDDDESELAQVWDESEGRGKKAAWKRAVKKLRGRLGKIQSALQAAARKKRPKGVPKNTVFDPEDQEWVVKPRRKGRQHGEERCWRADGTLASTCVYVDGVPHGPYKRFHESGEVAREGAYAHGKFDGVENIFHRSKQPTSEIAYDVHPEPIVRAEFVYRAGCLLASRWFNRGGKRVTPHGKPYPRRPARVPEDACYEDGWFAGETDEALRRHGTWRFWNTSGVLIQEIDYKADVEVAKRQPK